MRFQLSKKRIHTKDFYDPSMRLYSAFSLLPAHQNTWISAGQRGRRRGNTSPDLFISLKLFIFYSLQTYFCSLQKKAFVFHKTVCYYFLFDTFVWTSMQWMQCLNNMWIFQNILQGSVHEPSPPLDDKLRCSCTDFRKCFPIEMRCTLRT